MTSRSMLTNLRNISIQLQCAEYLDWPKPKHAHAAVRYLNCLATNRSKEENKVNLSVRINCISSLELN